MKKFDEVFNLDSITMNVTNNCNLNCTYCFEKSKNRMVMSPELATKAIDIAYNSCKNRPNGFMVNFFGGEPLLAWDTVKAVIDYCDKNKYEDVQYGITTNMTLITDEIVDYCIKHKIGVLASIDGVKEVHDKNRCNSYDRVMKALQKFKDKQALRFIEARITITPDYIDRAFEGVKLLYDYGIDNICPMCVYDMEWSDKQLEQAKIFYHQLFEFYYSIANDMDNKRNVYFKNCNDVIKSVLISELGSNQMCPIFSSKWITLDYKGDVYACHQSPTSTEEFKSIFKLGNILTTVDETKLQSKSELFKSCSFEMPECKDCVGRAICKGGCPSENMRLHNKHDKPSKAYCEINKIIVSTAKEFQYRLIHASNVRNTDLNNLIENVKLKVFVDGLISNIDIHDKLFVHKSKMQFERVQEMIEKLDEKHILIPSFADYINCKLEALILSISYIAQIDIDKITEKVSKGE